MVVSKVRDRESFEFNPVYIRSQRIQEPVPGIIGFEEICCRAIGTKPGRLFHTAIERTPSNAKIFLLLGRKHTFVGAPTPGRWGRVNFEPELRGNRAPFVLVCRMQPATPKVKWQTRYIDGPRTTAHPASCLEHNDGQLPCRKPPRGSQPD